MVACIAIAASAATATTLDIYFIDVEGGQATLVVTPAGETLLIDAGWPGEGTYESKAGSASGARDAQRIAAAAQGPRGGYITGRRQMPDCE